MSSVRLTERGELLLSWVVGTVAIIGVFLTTWGLYVAGAYVLGV